ncbi:MAG: FAD-binding protein [Thermodesulfovibrionales bacterium]|nr:FAD-binding protein [Thermodesulfovibrionales bacterium]
MADISKIEQSDSIEDLVCYSRDSSWVKGTTPKLIIWPKNTEQVIQIVKYAESKGLDIIARGAGTAMTGSTIPKSRESIILSLEKMKKILDINTKNMMALVEPGILNGTLQRELSLLGFFYPPDPASMDFCSIGGNVATNAGGPRAIKYGVTRDYVMELEIVLMDGTVLTVGGKTHKRVVGYNIKDLIIGSEGTLAIVTKVRLKFLPQPEEVVTLFVEFSDPDDCSEAIDRILGSNIIPRTLEFIDKGCIDAVSQYLSISNFSNANACLLIELDGQYHTVKAQADKVSMICNNLNGNVSLAKDPYSIQNLWSIRKSISPALYNLKKDKVSEDIVVPRDKIPVILKSLYQISDRNAVQIVCFGHAGDGNIHVNILTDNHSERARLDDVIKQIFNEVLKIGGSISGEHGIGITKSPYLSMELDKRQIAIMKEIKRIFDPQNRLNPNKIFVND